MNTRIVFTVTVAFSLIGSAQQVGSQSPTRAPKRQLERDAAIIDPAQQFGSDSSIPSVGNIPLLGAALAGKAVQGLDDLLGGFQPPSNDGGFTLDSTDSSPGNTASERGSAESATKYIDPTPKKPDERGVAESLPRGDSLRLGDVSGLDPKTIQAPENTLQSPNLGKVPSRPSLSAEEIEAIADFDLGKLPQSASIDWEKVEEYLEGDVLDRVKWVGLSPGGELTQTMADELRNIGRLEDTSLDSYNDPLSDHRWDRELTEPLGEFASGQPAFGTTSIDSSEGSEAETKNASQSIRGEGIVYSVDPILGVEHATYSWKEVLAHITGKINGATHSSPSLNRYIENKVRGLQTRLSKNETTGLQRWLNGFKSGLVVDGIFGPKTAAATLDVLKGFSKEAGACLVGGLGGGSVGLVPGGFVYTGALEVSGRFESAPRTAALCYGAAEAAVGAAQVANGLGTGTASVLACTTGAGCVVGAPAATVSAAMIAEGLVDVGAGVYVVASAAQRPPGSDDGFHGWRREAERGDRVWSEEDVVRNPDEIYYQPSDSRWVYLRSNGDGTSTVYIFEERVRPYVELDPSDHVTVMDKHTDWETQKKLDDGRWREIDPVEDP